MIDEKKLIEEIENAGFFIAGVARGKGMIMRFLQDYKKAIIKCINEQPKVGEWIPCSERLPKRDRPFQTGGYLVTAQFVKEGKRGKEFTTQASFDYENKRWLVRDCEVLAWRELPEPYNAERGGKNG